MNRLPKIGERVRFKGSRVVGPCTGTVRQHYEEYRYPKGADWDSDDAPAPIGLAPVEQWSVSVVVDEIPTPWPYGGRNSFAPNVSELEAISGEG